MIRIYRNGIFIVIIVVIAVIFGWVDDIIHLRFYNINISSYFCLGLILAFAYVTCAAIIP